MTTIERFIIDARKELQPVYDSGESDAVIRMLLEDVTGVSGATVFSQKSTPLNPLQEEKLHTYIVALRSGRPVQYVLGYSWFAGMKFKVNENVLIPRPETEELCDWIISNLAGRQDKLKILDVGTGSGCIAVTLKKRIADVSVIAVEISIEAIRVAKENTMSNGATVDFIEGDFLAEEFRDSLNGPYDLIVSNPPYISRSEMAGMDFRVTGFEPHRALFVNDADPLIFYRAIANFARKHLSPGGEMYFEINEALGDAVAELLGQHGFDAEFKKDLSGKNRMVRARFRRR